MENAKRDVGSMVRACDKCCARFTAENAQITVEALIAGGARSKGDLALYREDSLRVYE